MWPILDQPVVMRCMTVYKTLLQPNSKKTSITSSLTRKQQIRHVVTTKSPAKQKRMMAQKGKSGETSAGLSHLLSFPRDLAFSPLCLKVRDMGWPTVVIIQAPVCMCLWDEAQHQDIPSPPWAALRLTRIPSQGIGSVWRIPCK